MNRRRIVFAGGGSIQFAPSLLADVVRSEELGPATLVLHDIDAERLELIHSLAKRLVPEAKGDLKLEATTLPREALAQADAVIISIELDRFETWDLDRRIPKELGVPQALGENGGPGGLFHALRMIPGAVKLCREIEEECPDALVLNLSNPMSRMCLAIAETTRVRLVGLCHEIHGGKEKLSEVLGVPVNELSVVAAGVNHFTWFTRIEDSSGRDLYPTLRALAASDPARYVDDERLLVSEILRVTGAQCVTNDSHAGEYLRFGHDPRTAWVDRMSPAPFYETYRRGVAAIEAKVRSVLAGHTPLSAILDEPSGEEVIPILERSFAGASFASDALNLRNDGLIEGLPRWAIVEVPGEVSRAGGRGAPVADLPEWALAMCSVQAFIHKLTVRAALEGDRKAALEALLIDPSVPDPRTAERVFDALLVAHRAYLPAFA
ncbi:MAG: hypothetical protein HYV07_08960 [Deltaproteobacteria bacterium]|nr:hypothetical protein [Deltaproteobacteria bacterium]